MCQLMLHNDNSVEALLEKAEIVARVRPKVPKEGMKYYPHSKEG